MKIKLGGGEWIECQAEALGVTADGGCAVGLLFTDAAGKTVARLALWQHEAAQLEVALSAARGELEEP